MQGSMNSNEKVLEIIRLQQEALSSVERAKLLIDEADAIVEELKITYCKTFLCAGNLYDVVHRAIGFIPGNRYWVEPNKSVKTVE